MPVPKRKVSRSRRDKRKANLGIKPQAISYCFSGVCHGEPKLPHEVCLRCGFYKGKKVIRTKMDRELKRGETRGARAPEEIKAAEKKIQKAEITEEKKEKGKKS